MALRLKMVRCLSSQCQHSLVAVCTTGKLLQRNLEPIPIINRKLHGAKWSMYHQGPICCNTHYRCKSQRKQLMGYLRYTSGFCLRYTVYNVSIYQRSRSKNYMYFPEIQHIYENVSVIPRLYLPHSATVWSDNMSL